MMGACRTSPTAEAAAPYHSSARRAGRAIKEEFMDYASRRSAVADQYPQQTPENANHAAVDRQTLSSRVRRGILRLAAGRIRELNVEVREQTIVLRGRCGSYYCKQLAQHAAMELASGQRVDNRIEVD
jgi:hypothetical protein